MLDCAEILRIIDEAYATRLRSDKAAKRVLVEVGSRRMRMSACRFTSPTQRKAERGELASTGSTSRSSAPMPSQLVTRA
jgi:hypothetical protein